MHFMKFFILGVAMFAMDFVFFSTEASAQENRYRWLKEDQIKLFSNHTFWKENHLDRIFFAPDGSMTQQLNDFPGENAPGALLTGTWTVEDDQICWIYDEATATEYKTGSDPFCYRVLTNSPADNFMVTHMETFRLIPVNDDPDAPNVVAFDWDRYAYDNYVIDPEFVPTVQAALAQMAEYREAGNIPGGTIVRSELASPRMQAYYDEAINKVFFIAEEQMFFNDKGLFFFTDEFKIAEANGDVAQMLATGRKGQWQMKDNIHCWFLDDGGSSCEYVVPEGKGLMRPYEGFFGFHNTSFSRVHGEMAVGHLPPNETSAPELFTQLLEVAP